MPADETWPPPPDTPDPQASPTPDARPKTGCGLACLGSFLGGLVSIPIALSAARHALADYHMHSDMDFGAVLIWPITFLAVTAVFAIMGATTGMVGHLVRAKNIRAAIWWALAPGLLIIVSVLFVFSWPSALCAVCLVAFGIVFIARRR